jgi:hypothetical protein
MIPNREQWMNMVVTDSAIGVTAVLQKSPAARLASELRQLHGSISQSQQTPDSNMRIMLGLRRIVVERGKALDQEVYGGILRRIDGLADAWTSIETGSMLRCLDDLIKEVEGSRGIIAAAEQSTADRERMQQRLAGEEGVDLLAEGAESMDDEAIGTLIANGAVPKDALSAMRGNGKAAATLIRVSQQYACEC